MTTDSIAGPARGFGTLVPSPWITAVSLGAAASLLGDGQSRHRPAREGVRGESNEAVHAGPWPRALDGRFFMFLLARMAWGACGSYLRLGAYLAVLQDSEVSRWGYSIGFYNGMAGAGTLVAVLCGGVLTDTIGFRGAVFFFSSRPESP